MLQSFSFKGDRPGPHLLCLGGVHGNEPCGVFALRRIVDRLSGGDLHLKAGRLTIVPCCNEKAVEKDIIYIDENLNRCVRKYDAPQNNEQKAAHALTSFIDQCDIMIDLHSTTAPTTPFGFLDTDSAEGRVLAGAVGLEKILIGWPALYPEDQSPTTQTYAEGAGKLALTIECGQHRDVEAPLRAEKYILNALSYLGLTPAGPLPSVTTAYLKMTGVFYQKDNLSFVKQCQNFTPVKQGDAIAANAKGILVIAPYDGEIIMPRAVAKDGEELFYMATAI